MSHGPVRLLLALPLALGVQTAYVNPGAAAAELRAMSCCARHCDAPVSMPSVRGCCGVTVVESGPAEAPVVQGGSPLVPAMQTLSTAVQAPPAVTWARAQSVHEAGSGPPTFLEQRHLLL